MRVVIVGRVPDQPYGLVATLGEEALQQQRDLSMPARYHYAHAASLLIETIAEAATAPAAVLRSSNAAQSPKAQQGGADCSRRHLRQNPDVGCGERRESHADESASDFSVLR